MEDANLPQLFINANPENAEINLAIIANAASMAAGAPAYLGLYLTVISGYLIAAFVAGDRLKQKQVRLINAIFVVSSVFLAANALFVFIGTNATFMAANITDGARALLYGWLIFDLIIFVIMILGIFACIGFMKDVREKSESKGT